MGELGNCVVCGEDASVLYPLLPNSPAFCSEHHNPKDAGPFGADFSGPDNFDIPCGWECEDTPWFFRRPFEEAREVFEWRDKDGVKHKLGDIDDRYLSNIISFLRGAIHKMDMSSIVYWAEVIVFLEDEQRIRKTVKEVNNDKLETRRQ